MFIVGLTGGIGSGKSVVSNKFLSLHINVNDADIASRKIVEPGQPALVEIENHFGSDILTKEGFLNRGKLREVIFSDPKEKKWLESILHPKIREYLVQEIEGSSSPYSILVSPLLLETNQYQLCSRILLVDVPRGIQVKRTVLRDKVPESQIEKIILSQMDREKRLEKADDVLLNTGTVLELEEQVLELHKKYLQMLEP